MYFNPEEIEEGVTDVQKDEDSKEKSKENIAKAAWETFQEGVRRDDFSTINGIMESEKSPYSMSMKKVVKRSPRTRRAIARAVCLFAVLPRFVRPALFLPVFFSPPKSGFAPEPRYLADSKGIRKHFASLHMHRDFARVALLQDFCLFSYEPQEKQATAISEGWQSNHVCLQDARRLRMG
ncbi:hypothetical protein SUGI_1079620 [Cryptomeria japonica]|nr:hypothetical protein SUGI_1079620 [Cryptomeria japonica]